MCRTKKSGGRRCPQHTDPVKHAAYNARRRELYAEKKDSTKVESEESIVIVDHDDSVDYGFLPLDKPRKPYKFSSKLGKAFAKDANEFAKAIQPDFDVERWRLRNVYHENIATDDPIYNEGRFAFLEYTASNYALIGVRLNGRNLSSKRHDNFKLTKDQENELDRKIETLDELFTRIRQPSEPRTLYRGMQVPDTVEQENVDSWLESKFPVGGIVSQKNYMSTSLNPKIAAGFSYSDHTDPKKVARAVIFEIRTTEGAPLSHGTSSYGDTEAEVLLPRDLKLKVVKRETKASHTIGSFLNRKNQVSISTVIQLVDADYEGKTNVQN
jgi:hypothetical protein